MENSQNAASGPLGAYNILPKQVWLNLFKMLWNLENMNIRWVPGIWLGFIAKMPLWNEVVFSFPHLQKLAIILCLSLFLSSKIIPAAPHCPHRYTHCPLYLTELRSSLIQRCALRDLNTWLLLCDKQSHPKLLMQNTAHLLFNCVSQVWSEWNRGGAKWEFIRLLGMEQRSRTRGNLLVPLAPSEHSWFSALADFNY